MTTFDMTRWVDFVRGVGDPESHRSMEEHLRLDPSSPAHRQVAALRRVMALAETDRQLEIPDYAVRCAKAFGSLRRAEAPEEVSLLERVRMALTFDSRATPAFAGVRDMQPADRRLRFAADDLGVELRVEQDLEGTVLVGQLWRGLGDDVATLAHVPVLALAESEVVARTVTNEYGEFQAEGLPDSTQVLYFLVDDEQCLEVSLAQNA